VLKVHKVLERLPVGAQVLALMRTYVRIADFWGAFPKKVNSRVPVLNPEFLILNLTILLVAAGCRSGPSTPAVPPVDLPPSGPISIALTGDTSFSTLDGASSNALDLVRDATVGFTNLEVNLLDSDAARAAGARPQPRWIFAPGDQSSRVRAVGFDVVSLANNHTMDSGAEGLASTLGALDAAGIVHAGAGADLGAARAAGVLGRGARRVAVVAVTASASDQARASASQQNIQGRPGVSSLLYDAAITVDAATYRTLAQSVQSLQAGPPPGDRELTMFGRRITRGDATRVDFTLRAGDEEQVLAVIREARRQAEVVLVSVHSHEPSNESDEPAEFLRQFAHDAVAAGAHLIVGHGPHRMRGVEIYKGVPIFYSLGNFIFRTNGLDFRAADQFDAGSNLYTAALGASAAATSSFSQLDQDWWWQGALVVATSERGVLSGVKLYPVNLKGTGQTVGKGLPQLATGAEAATVLRQISMLSKRLGTDLGEGASRGVLDVPISENR
jgi:poly-gamma-glutamate capsule biosynthesis protein CapA/YwtB (metallophosphatase superfamily)